MVNSIARRDSNEVPNIMGLTATNELRNILTNNDGSLAVGVIDGTGTTAAANPTIELQYTGDNITKIIKTVNGKAYTKTLTYSGLNLIGISAWVSS